MGDVTCILAGIEQGDIAAAERLLRLVYEDLRRLAAAKLVNERPGQTLQATALVHDAYLRLVDVAQAQHWNSRGHFFGAAAEAIAKRFPDCLSLLCEVAQVSSLRSSKWQISTYRTICS